MARKRTFKACICAAEVECDCEYTPGTPSSFDDPGDPPEIEIKSVTLYSTGRLLTLNDKALEKLTDQLYENLVDDYDDED